ncbi:MAG: hypothetical protein ACXWZS_07110 [Gemmatirosa sp.]
MTLPDPSHPAYAVPCRAEPAAEAVGRPTEESRTQLYLALRARDGRPFTAAYTASVERAADPIAPVAPDRAQLSLFGR